MSTPVAHGLPHHASPLQLRRRRLLTAHSKLHRPIPLIHEARGRRGKRFQVVGAPQEPARVGGHPVPIAAQQLVDGLPQRLALDVPQRDVHRRRGPRDHPLRRAAAHRAQPLANGLDVHGVAANGKLRHGVDALVEGFEDDVADEARVPDPLDAVVGPQGQRDKGRNVRPPDGRPRLARDNHSPGLIANNLHRPSMSEA